MFKDLIENVNKLNNKVDRLESVSQKKEMTEKATQSSVVQTFTNGSHSSNKKVYIKNILKEDLEYDKGDILINKHNTVDEEPIINNKKDKITPQCLQADNTILEDIDKKRYM